MIRTRGCKAFLAALCVSALAVDPAWAQDAADAAAQNPAPTASPTTEDASRPGWLLRGRNRGVVNPFRVAPPPGTGRAFQNRAPAGSLPLAGGTPGVGSQTPAGSAANCTIGFRRQGVACVAVQIPENGTLDLTGHGWMCNRGFRRQGLGCVAIVLPENASLDASGRRWECNHGFRRQGQACTAVVVPEHASLAASGRAWTCNQGYQRRDQGCIDDATARLQHQADRAVNARPGAAPAAGSRPPVSVTSGENRNGRTSKAKVVIGRF